MHCHKVERVTQVIDNKAVAVLAGLPYRLSPTLILRLSPNQLNRTTQSTLHTAVTPYWSFYTAQPVLNKDPTKAFLPFGATVMIKLTDGQRTTLASKESFNTNNVAKSALSINLGTSIHHPGDNMFYRTDSPDLLPRQRWEPISIFEPFSWKSQRVLQQTYIQHETPTSATSFKPLTTPSCDHPSTNFNLPTSHPSYFLLQLLLQRLLLTFRC
jgi:hypothetical protein